MAGLLAAMLAFALGAVFWSRSEIKALQNDIAISDSYGQTALNAAMAVGYSGSYTTSGSPDDLLRYQEALVQTFYFQNLTKELGTDEDREYLAALEARFAGEIASATAALNGVPASGDESGSSGLTEVTNALREPAEAKRLHALNHFDHLQSRLDGLFLLMVVSALIGIPLVAVFYFVTRRSEHNDTVQAVAMETLKQAALTDGLTGLANHRAFQEDLRRDVGRAGRSGQPIGIAMLDIDNFKEINDSEGHIKGDAVLAELGRLIAYLRAGDRGYRIGGDEFALIMQDTDAGSARAALSRLCTSIQVSMPTTTVSIGFTTTTANYSPEMLRDHADMALYEAKRRGKNQVVSFSPELVEGIESTAEKVLALRRVLQSGVVSSWFQPIYRLGTRELLAFEALLRLPGEPEITGPEEAFDIAHSLGRSFELDALSIAKVLSTAGDLPEGVKLFINLDPGTVVNSRFSVPDMVQAVVDAGLAPTQVVFEITERSAAPVMRLREQVEALRASGFGAALDDVGTGNSGLELMRLIKFDYVKIDRSVIMDAIGGGQGRAVLVAIAAFARETGSFMIAEGIEDFQTLDGVREYERGISDYWIEGVQGFLLGGPSESIKSFLTPRDPSTTWAAA